MGNIISIVLSRENLYQEEEYINSNNEVKIDILSEYSDRDWIYYHMERDNGVDILG
jgi:hypothetical protein